MRPDIDLLLQVVERALREVVGPAVDPNNPAALSQANLCASIVSHVRKHHHLAGKLSIQELRNAVYLAERVLATATGATALADLIALAKDTLESSGSEDDDLDAARRQLLETVAGVVKEAGDSSTAQKLAQIVIEASKPQLDLARAWFRETGHEPDPDATPRLEAELDRLNG